MLREEHKDLFGSLSSGVYNDGVTAVTNAAVTGPVIPLVNDDAVDGPAIVLHRLRMWINEAFVTADSATLDIEVKCANALSSGALSSPVTVYSKTGIAASALLADAKPYVDIIIPTGYKYVQAKLTPASTKSFSKGKVSGYIEPEFN